MAPISSAEKIALLGIGLMGSAIGNALLKAGHPLHIWNRTTSKCSALAGAGAICQPTAKAAVAAADILILVLIDYAATLQVLSDLDLTGKSIIQVAGGSLEEVEALVRHCNARGASAYLEVSVMTYPHLIGPRTGLLVTSGSATAYRRLTPIFTALGTSRFAGENLTAAKALTNAYGVYVQIAIAGAFEAAQLAEAMHIDLAVLFEIASLTRDNVDGVLARLPEAAQREGRPAPARFGTLSAHLDMIRLQLQAARNFGASLPILEFVHSSMQRRAELGFADADIEDGFRATRLPHRTHPTTPTIKH
jgi:3-hydroxyisobutyrate dehydrogenase-like beta-hydroxyacid dehydrogenase